MLSAAVITVVVVVLLRICNVSGRIFSRIFYKIILLLMVMLERIVFMTVNKK